MTVPIEQLLYEFDTLSKWSRPVTDEELAHAQDSLVRGFAQRFETMSQVAGEIAELEGYGLSTDELGRYPERIESITKDQLEAAAAKYLNTDEAILLVVGDGEKVADGLSALEFGSMKRLDVEGELLD